MGNETFYGDGLSRLMKTNPKKMLCRKREISATPIQLHLKEVYGEFYPRNLAPNLEMKAISYAGKTFGRCSIVGVVCSF